MVYYNPSSTTVLDLNGLPCWVGMQPNWLPYKTTKESLSKIISSPSLFALLVYSHSVVVVCLAFLSCSKSASTFPANLEPESYAKTQKCNYQNPLRVLLLKKGETPALSICINWINFRLQSF